MKIYYQTSQIKWRLTKLLRIMRITTLLLLIGLMQTYATNSYSQNTKLSLKMEDASIESILSQIEKVSEFHFFYRSNEIDRNGKFNVDANQQTVDEVLNSLLKDSNLTYKVFDKYIAIVSKENANKNIESLLQQKPVKGKVTDSSGGSLPGVSVVVKGTTTGVITDNDGNYSLANIPENATLQFSFVGMKTKEMVVGSKASVDVVLDEETVGIEEVVAIGYGVQKKKLSTGSTIQMKGDDLQKMSTISPLTAMQSMSPGISITQNSGKPGSDFKINIRGLGTIGNASPLIVIDNVTGGDLNSLNPGDIESIDVLTCGRLFSQFLPIFTKTCPSR